jgi:hypothetical protein
MIWATCGNAVSIDTDQGTAQHISDDVDEIITSFAEAYAKMAELERVLQRTCRRTEDALALARAMRRLRL